MKALTRYRMVQGSGLWRADPAAQRRDVAVSLGAGSLTLRDARSGAVVAHWSLAALERENPGRTPAIWRPGTEGESLESDDATLIEAMETVHVALNPAPRGRWLRWGVLAAGLVVVALGLALLPRALIQRAAAIAPDAMRVQIGREALDRLTAPGGAARVCADPAGRQALTQLRNRALGPDWRVVVIDGIAGFEAGHLPGRMIILNRSLVERLDSAETLAGWLILQAALHDARDPMLDVLAHAGTRATLGMLTSGELAEDALRGFAQTQLARPAAWPDAGPVAARMGAIGIAFQPLVTSLPPEAARLAAVLAAGPDEGVALLTDGEWLTLQAVCQG
jgi:hypothetical protein